MVLADILIAVTIVSLISFVGVVTLSFKKGFLHKTLILLVGFAAGALLGAAFFDLLPEGLRANLPNSFVYVVAGMMFFFITERFISWHHHHHGKTETHTFTYMNIIGDSIHNFTDGVVIAAAFLHSFNLGVVTTLAVIFHEIPQEIGDFSILIYGGFSVPRALFYNFMTALTSVLGAVLAYFYLSETSTLIPALLLFGAGGLIYIASTDLFPELMKENDYKSGLKQFVAILVGIILIWWIVGIAPA